MNEQPSKPRKKIPTGPSVLEPSERPVPPGFGPYLAGLRKERGLSLRDAALLIGISFGYLRKLESAERIPRPSILMLQQVAGAYNVPSAEVFHAAGIQSSTLADHAASVNRVFRRLVLHPRLMPRGMDAPQWLDSFSTRQKSQWIEFAQRLESFQLDSNEEDNRTLLEILRGVPVPSEEEEEK